MAEAVFQRVRKRPIVVHGFQWDGDRASLPAEVYVRTQAAWREGGDVLYLATSEGPLVLRPGDWVMKGVNGELYPCKPDVFEKTYDVLDG